MDGWMEPFCCFFLPSIPIGMMEDNVSAFTVFYNIYGEEGGNQKMMRKTAQASKRMEKKIIKLMKEGIHK